MIVADDEDLVACGADDKAVTVKGFGVDLERGGKGGVSGADVEAFSGVGLGNRFQGNAEDA